MTAFHFKADTERFEPTWIEFHKPIFLGGYGYVNSVDLSAQKEDRPDRPRCAGASKTPDGWLVWMASGAAALIPETNIRYVGAVRVSDASDAVPVPAANRFSHLPADVRAKVMAQAEGGFAGDAGIAALGRPQPVAEATAQPSTSALEAPAKKRRGRPPKVRPEAEDAPSE